MNLWAKKFLPVLITTLLVVFLSKTPVFAHPGRTASDGCHYCRTNCDKWGVTWNARHCHGGTVSTPSPRVEQTPTPIIITPTPPPIPSPSPFLKPPPSPSPSPSPSPIPSPSLSPSPSPSLSPAPQQSPEVKGVTEEQEVEPLSNKEAIGFLGFLGALFGGLGWGIYKLLRKFASKKAS